MDIFVHYWDHDKVTSRFYRSEFMGHADAEIMLDHFTNCVHDLSFLRKLEQVSMYGPSVNWKFHRDLQQQISDNYDNMLLDIGSCGLHVSYMVLSRLDLRKVISCGPSKNQCIF